MQHYQQYTSVCKKSYVFTKCNISAPEIVVVIAVCGKSCQFSRIYPDNNFHLFHKIFYIPTLYTSWTSAVQLRSVGGFAKSSSKTVIDRHPARRVISVRRSSNKKRSTHWSEVYKPLIEYFFFLFFLLRTKSSFITGRLVGSFRVVTFCGSRIFLLPYTSLMCFAKPCVYGLSRSVI